MFFQATEVVTEIKRKLEKKERKRKKREKKRLAELAAGTEQEESAPVQSTEEAEVRAMMSSVEIMGTLLCTGVWYSPAVIGTPLPKKAR